MIVAIGYLLTALSVYLVGQTTSALLIFAVFAASVTVQTSLPALAAAFYPTRGRASGISWMMGIGRFGVIAGSFLVAELTRRQLSLSSIFLCHGDARHHRRRRAPHQAGCLSAAGEPSRRHGLAGALTERKICHDHRSPRPICDRPRGARSRHGDAARRARDAPALTGRRT